MHYETAEEYVRNLSVAGGGWRIPTTAEIQEVREIHALRPALNMAVGQYRVAWSNESCIWFDRPGHRAFNFSDFSISQEVCRVTLYPGNDLWDPPIVQVLAVRSAQK